MINYGAKVPTQRKRQAGFTPSLNVRIAQSAFRTTARSMQQTLHNRPPLNCHDKTMRTSSAGFTLTEALVAISILVLLTTIVLSVFRSFNRAATLDTVADNVAALVVEARTLTLASKAGAVYGVHFATTSATLFSGSSFVPGDPDNEEFALPSAVVVSDTALSGGGEDVVFERLTGKTAQSGAVTLELAADSTIERIIRIDPAGTVEVE